MELQPNVHVLVPISIISSIKSKGTLKQHQTFISFPSPPSFHSLGLLMSPGPGARHLVPRMRPAPQHTCLPLGSCAPECNPHASHLMTYQHIKRSQQGELIKAFDHHSRLTERLLFSPGCLFWRVAGLGGAGWHQTRHWLNWSLQVPSVPLSLLMVMRELIAFASQ